MYKNSKNQCSIIYAFPSETRVAQAYIGAGGRARGAAGARAVADEPAARAVAAPAPAHARLLARGRPRAPLLLRRDGPGAVHLSYIICSTLMCWLYKYIRHSYFDFPNTTF